MSKSTRSSHPHAGSGPDLPSHSPAPRPQAPARKDGSPPPPDLQTQLEAALHAVWQQEAAWRSEELIDLAVRLCRDR
jgi:hypothetical protein